MALLEELEKKLERKREHLETAVIGMCYDGDFDGETFRELLDEVERAYLNVCIEEEKEGKA